MTGERPPLPPHLDPRGRIAGMQANRAAARAAGEQPTRRAAGRDSGNRRTDIRRGVRLGLQVLAAVLSLAVVCGSGWAWATYRSFQSNITQVNALPAPGPSDSDAAAVVDDGKDMNIVLVGKDDRSTATDAQLEELGTERDGGSVLTDTMMMLHVPADGSRATLISFPRDSWVKIPGHGSAKLNAAYAYGSDNGANPDAGRQLMIQSIQNLTGLSVDHYVEIDLLGFYNISNAIGGVSVNLCEAQQDEFSGIDLPAGEQKIQGLQAMAFVRQRHGLDAYGGDLARAKRQQYFLTQVFKQVQSAGVLLNPIKLQNLMNAVSGSLKMDDPGFALPLARQMANLSAGNIITATIPTTGFGTSPDGQSIVVVDTTAMPDFIAQVIGASADSKYDSAAPAAPGATTVDVLNGAGIAGIAGANAQALRGAGFTVHTVSDAATTASTTIRYPDGMQAQAKALAAQVPGAVLSRSGAVSTVTLIVGQNNIQVASLTPAGSAPAPGDTQTGGAPAGSAEPTPSTSAEGTRTGSDDSCIH